MGRPQRHLAAGACYHVATKGNNDQPIFRDDWDRAVFVQLLRRVRRRYGWRLHARCLLGNHYHLLVETPQANLSQGMRDLNGEYAMGWEDALQTKITVKLGETVKTVRTLNEGEVPIELRTIYLAIDGAASHVIWTDGKASNVTRMPGF